MIVKMTKNLENKSEKMQESINKDLEELKNKHTETNNTITEIKNTQHKCYPIQSLHKPLDQPQEGGNQKERQIQP